MGQMTQEEYKSSVRAVYRTTLILSAVTIIEVGFALFYEFYLMEHFGAPRMLLNLFVIAASIVKAYWIMAVFMHLGHENKTFIFTILFPLVFLIWGVICFCWEGASWQDMINAMNSIWLN
ncbi:MAG: cytochrome C oxidase subunit IV family protein [Chitinophagales bacterium]